MNANGGNGRKTVVKRLLFNKTGIITLILVAVSIVLLGVFNRSTFEEYYYSDDNYREDIILVKPADDNRTNADYIKSKKLSSISENSNAKITYNDITEILANEAVEYVYLINKQNLDALLEKQPYSSGLIELSFPEECMQFMQNGNYVLDEKNIFGGRLPQECSREIVIPVNSQNEIFKNKKIGTDIIYNEIKYKIVGFHVYDVVFLPFNGKNEYIAKLTRKVLENEYGNSMQAYLESEKTDSTASTMLVIKCKAGREKDVLNSLVIKYPNSGYESYYYGKAVAYYRNFRFIIGISVFNLLYVLVFSIITIKNCKKRRVLLDNEFEGAKDPCQEKDEIKKICRNVDLVVLLTAFLIAVILVILTADFLSEILVSMIATVALALVYFLIMFKTYKEA